MGRRIRELREEMGYTQTELGEQLAAHGVTVSQGHMGHMESGRRMPSVEVLTALAQVLDTSTDYLLGMTENQLSAKDVEEELAAGGIGGRFERVMARLSPGRRDQVVEYANYLAMVDQVSSEQVNNLRALQAVLNVMERSLTPDAMDTFWGQLAGEFPSLAGVLSTRLEQKRVSER